MSQFNLGEAAYVVAATASTMRESRNSDLSKELALSMQQLHGVYASLACAATEFVSDEDFHQRTGWYRENVIGLAREISRAMRSLVADEA